MRNRCEGSRWSLPLLALSSREQRAQRPKKTGTSALIPNITPHLIHICSSRPGNPNPPVTADLDRGAWRQACVGHWLYLGNVERWVDQQLHCELQPQSNPTDHSPYLERTHRTRCQLSWVHLDRGVPWWHPDSLWAVTCCWGPMAALQPHIRERSAGSACRFHLVIRLNGSQRKDLLLPRVRRGRSSTTAMWIAGPRRHCVFGEPVGPKTCYHVSFLCCWGAPLSTWLW